MPDICSGAQNLEIQDEQKRLLKTFMGWANLFSLKDIPLPCQKKRTLFSITLLEEMERTVVYKRC